MSRQHSDGEEAYRAAQHAQRLLNDEHLEAAFESAKADYVEAWVAAADPVEREKMWHRIHAIEDVKRDLRAVIGDMEMAEARESKAARRKE